MIGLKLVQAGYRHIDYARAYDNEKEACLCGPTSVHYSSMKLTVIRARM